MYVELILEQNIFWPKIEIFDRTGPVEKSPFWADNESRWFWHILMGDGIASISQNIYAATLIICVPNAPKMTHVTFVTSVRLFSNMCTLTDLPMSGVCSMDILVVPSVCGIRLGTKRFLTKYWNIQQDGTCREKSIFSKKWKLLVLTYFDGGWNSIKNSYHLCCYID